MCGAEWRWVEVADSQRSVKTREGQIESEDVSWQFVTTADFNNQRSSEVSEGHQMSVEISGDQWWSVEVSEDRLWPRKVRYDKLRLMKTKGVSYRPVEVIKR